MGRPIESGFIDDKKLARHASQKSQLNPPGSIFSEEFLICDGAIVMKADWIFSIQGPGVLKKYPGPVAWVNWCKRCGREEPVYQGPLDVAIYQSKQFIKIHKGCKGGRINGELPNLQKKEG